MPMLTLGQASQASGKAKSSLLVAIRDGRLSATRDDKNRWSIDPAELFRAFPEQSPERDRTPETEQRTPAELARELALVRAEQLRERETLNGVISDLRADRDHWRRQATALLGHTPSPHEPVAPPKPAAVRPVFLGALALAGALAALWLALDSGIIQVRW